jgi:methyl-accepting chemotaxis protein
LERQVAYLLPMDESDVLGEHTAESIKKESASDKTLADNVVDAPYRTHEEYDIDRIETPYTECLVYEDTGMATDVNGNETYLEYNAILMFGYSEFILSLIYIRIERRQSSASER